MTKGKHSKPHDKYSCADAGLCGCQDCASGLCFFLYGEWHCGKNGCHGNCK